MSKQSKLSRFFAAAPPPKAAPAAPSAGSAAGSAAGGSTDAQQPGAARSAPPPSAAAFATQPPRAAAAAAAAAAEREGAGALAAELELGGFAFAPPALALPPRAAPPRSPPTAPGKRAAASAPRAAPVAAPAPKRARGGGGAPFGRGRSGARKLTDAADEPDARASSGDDDAASEADDERAVGERQAEHDPAAPNRPLADGDVAPGDRLGRAEGVPTVAAVAASLGLPALTPLERQVVALKASHAGYVLLFEVGYRYSLFGEDAAVAAAVLDIWAYRKGHFTTASVPTHRLETHLARLLAAGLRVGVVAQVESAAQKKAGVGGGARSGAFERRVQALYSAGSYVPPSDSTSLVLANQIVAVCEAAAPGAAAGAAGGAAGGAASSVRVSLLALDSYSNALLYDEFDDGPLRAELHARLGALQPAEVLAPAAATTRAAAGGGGGGGDGGDGARAVGLSRETAMALLHYAALPVGVGALAGARLELLDADAFSLGAALDLLAGAGAGAGRRRGGGGGAGTGGGRGVSGRGATGDGGAAEEDGETSAQAELAAAAASALPPGVGRLLGALSCHLSAMVGAATCATLLRVALGSGGGGGASDGADADASAPAGRCVPWASARSCRLGAAVLRDLDVFEAAALPGAGAGSGCRSLFAHLNRTHTQPGARLLRRWLCTPLREPAAIAARLSAVGLLCRALDAQGGKERAAGRAPPPRRAPAVTPFALAGGGGGGGGEGSAQAAPPAATDLLGLTAAMAASPCADMERALARLAARRCAPPELWALLVTAEALLGSFAAGLAVPAAADDADAADADAADADADADADGADADNSAVGDAVASGRRLLAGLVGDVRAGGGATRAADVALLAQVRGWLRGLRREGMMGAELTSAFELGEGGAAREPLRAAARAIDAVERALRTDALPAARVVLRRPAAEFKKVLGEEFLLEVPAAAARGVPADWARVCATKTAVRFRPPQVAALWAALQLAREDYALRASDAFDSLCRDVTARTAPLRAVVHRLATLDVLAAFARVARAHGYARPTVLRASAAAEAAGAAQPAACLRVRGARHPTHELALAAGCQFVPNDIDLSAAPNHLSAAHDRSAHARTHAPASGGGGGGAHGGGDARRCALLFGPNSGGKSLYARTALTHALLAQVGCWLPCEAASLSPFDGLYTRIGSHDNILKGESTFFVELNEAAAILRDATARSLVLFDELGRGTSTHDGTAIAHATLAHMLSAVRCCALFISHYPSLASLELEQPEALGSYHMSYVEHDDDDDGGEVERAERAGGADDAAVAPAVTATATAARGRGRAGRRVTMLFKLARGKLETSFGVNVARVAQLPAPVLREAARRSEAFERLATQRRLLVGIQRTLAAEPPADGRAPTSLEALQAEATEALARRAA